MSVAVAVASLRRRARAGASFTLGDAAAGEANHDTHSHTLRLENRCHSACVSSFAGPVAFPHSLSLAPSSPLTWPKTQPKTHWRSRTKTNMKETGKQKNTTFFHVIKWLDSFFNVFLFPLCLFVFVFRLIASPRPSRHRPTRRTTGRTASEHNGREHIDRGSEIVCV